MRRRAANLVCAAAAPWWGPSVRAAARSMAHNAAPEAVDAAGPRVAAQVVAVWKETPSVQGIRLQSGQWVDFWVPGLREMGGFSIVTTPSMLAAHGTFDLAVKSTRHPVAEWICSKAAPGAKVHVRAGGTFTLHPTTLRGNPSLFVAGGIGVTPLVALLSELVEAWHEAEGVAAPKDSSAGGSDCDDEEGSVSLLPHAEGPSAILVYSARAPEEFALLRRLLDLQRASAGRLQVRLHTSEYRPRPRDGAGGGPRPWAGGGVVVGALGDQGAAAAAAAAAAAEEEEGPRRPAAVLIPGGARSLTRRRVLPSDLQSAVHDLQVVAPSGGTGAQVTAYVCGPPALADAVVAQLEHEVEGIGEVVMERWW